LEHESYHPEDILQYVHSKVKSSREDIKEALTGYVTPHHRFMLKTIMRNILGIESTIAEVDTQIEVSIEPYKVKRELLESIPGVSKVGSTCIIAEVGVNMGRFPDQNHLASWAEGFALGAMRQPARTKADASPTGTNICVAFW